MRKYEGKRQLPASKKRPKKRPAKKQFEAQKRVSSQYSQI